MKRESIFYCIGIHTVHFTCFIRLHCLLLNLIYYTPQKCSILNAQILAFSRREGRVMEDGFLLNIFLMDCMLMFN
jgi:hypothetical protein